ncbi:MAG: DUF2891 domain-containing protein [Ilumatobacteraceae bacterium]
MAGLEEHAGGFSATILDAVQRVYPNDLRHRMDGPDDRPTPTEVHPAFFGCYDWHSAVEMHWALARLLRGHPDQVHPDTRPVLDRHLTHDRLAVEAAYFVGRPGFSRPYGWGWVFTLAADLRDWDDADARRWADAMAPLTSTLSSLLQAWLPNVHYPVRHSVHPNSAFALARTWRFAEHDEPLRVAIVDAAERWFAHDRDYPAAWEPSSADFLSGALTEAELMSMVLPPHEFASWWHGFLPSIPDSLTTPATVTDTTDGQLAHLHGLNLSRAHAFRTISTSLGGVGEYDRIADDHLAASIGAVSGDDYMVEHWLAAYAVLALTGG